MAPRKMKVGRRPRRPPGETRRGRFIRLAELRVQKLVRIMQRLPNLRSHNYQYNDTDIKEIVAFIDKKWAETKQKLQPPEAKVPPPVEFRLVPTDDERRRA